MEFHTGNAIKFHQNEIKQFELIFETCHQLKAFQKRKGKTCSKNNFKCDFNCHWKKTQLFYNSSSFFY